MKEHTLTLQVLSNKVQQIPTSIVQNDSDTNVILISLVDATNKPYSLGTITSIGCKVLKENGNIAILGTSNVVTTDWANGKIKVTLPSLAVSQAGVCQAVIEFYDTGKRVTTARFSYLVTADIMGSANQQIDVDTAIQLTTLTQNAMGQFESFKTTAQAAEIMRVNNESTRVSNENTRVANESSRSSSESTRVSNEIARVNSESTRANAENTRISKENVRIASEETRNTAESTRLTKETARINAESTRAANEDERKNSELLRKQDENSREVSELNREINEYNRNQAELTRQGKEAERLASETERLGKENTRIANESDRVLSEDKRKENEAARVTVENNRVNTEATRVSNETTRENREATRVSNESTRVSNENARVTSETARVSAESTRATSETARINAESTRSTNETVRVNSEVTRASNEAARVNAEAGRVTTFNAQVATIAEKTTTSINGERSNVNLISSGETVESLNGKKFASNTDIVKDRANRTQDTINRVFYKQNCKEFTSNGEAITVNNGMDGYVLSATLQGNTIKNYVSSVNDYTTEFGLLTGVDGLYRVFDINREQILATSEYTLDDKEYTAIFINDSNTKENNNISIYKDGVSLFSKTANEENILKYKFTSVSGSKYRLRIYKKGAVSQQKVACMLLEGDWTNKNIPLFYGLNSTQAVVYNNNLKYSFYSNLEDKLAGKVIDLYGLEGATNSLEIKDGGSVVHTENFYKKVLDGSENWNTDPAFDNSGYYGVWLQNVNFPLNNCVELSNTSIQKQYMSNLFTVKPRIFTEELISVHNVGSVKWFYINILKSRLTTPDVAGVKAWLQTNPITIIYKLATPVVTTIPKEAVPTILTQATNEFTFGNGVMATKATISVPVDRIGEMQTQINEIKALITTPSNINLTMNYVEDEYNKNQSIEGVV